MYKHNASGSDVRGSNTHQRDLSIVVPSYEDFYSGNMGESTGPRYTPPIMRSNIPLPEVRPGSSVSNTTFASQIPPPLNDISRNDSGKRVSFSYSFAPQQHAQRVYAGSGNGFVDPSRAGSPLPTRQSNNFGAVGTTVSNSHHAHEASTQSSSAFGGTVTGPANTSNLSGGAIANGPVSNQSAGSDSVIGNTRAYNLANMIRAGMADDPNDPDYGNPGRSRRLPPEKMSSNVPVAPQPRGKIATEDTVSVFGQSAVENTKGVTVAFLGAAELPPPAWLQQVSKGFKPSVEEVFDVLPMIEACRAAAPSTAGVVKITNLPYATSRSEIVAFFGKNAQIINQPEGSPYYAVHIMMERHTAKTMDAFVELRNAKEATYVVTQFARRIQSGRHVKLGDRCVAVEMSSQGELMAELFPRAKHVEWEGAMPVVDNKNEFYYENVKAAGFKGFLQNEEITHLVKHAETPQRVSEDFVSADRSLLTFYYSLRLLSVASRARTRISSPSFTSIRGTLSTTSYSVSATLCSTAP